MIIVNCKDVPSLKSPLAIYTSDHVGAIPVLKLHEFVLDPINESIDSAAVIKAIKNFLNSLAIEKHYAVIQKNNMISILSIDDYKLESVTPHLTDHFFSCVHCGHVTQFETVHNNHMKIHYL